MSYAPPPGFPQEPTPAKKASYWWWVVPLVILFTVATVGYYIMSTKEVFDTLMSEVNKVPLEAKYTLIGPEDELGYRQYDFTEYGYIIPLPATPTFPRGSQTSVREYEKVAVLNSSDPSMETSVYMSMAISFVHRGDDTTGMAAPLIEAVDEFADSKTTKKVADATYGEFAGEELDATYTQRGVKYRLMGFCGQRNKVAVLFYVIGPPDGDIQEHYQHITGGIKQSQITE